MSAKLEKSKALLAVKPAKLAEAGTTKICPPAVTPVNKPAEASHDSHHAGHLEAAGEVFTFTVSNGQVTAAAMNRPNGTVLNLPLNTGVVYSLDGSDLLATRTDAQGTQTVRYSDADNDGLFQVVASSKIMTTAPTVNMLGFGQREKLAVTLDATDGHVTGVSQALANGTQKVLLSATVGNANTTWAIDQGLLVETVTNAAGQTRWEVFRDGNLDGVYTEVAEGTGALVDLVGVLSATQAVVAQL